MHRLRGNGRGLHGPSFVFSLEVLIVLRLDWKTQSEIQRKTSKNMGCQENTKNDRSFFFAIPHRMLTAFFSFFFFFVSGRGGYGVGVNVMVLVNGQWLPGKAQRDAQQMAAMFGMLESSMAILSTLDFYKPRLRLLNWEGTIKKY